MDAGFCNEALKEAKTKHGAPEICARDQRVQVLRLWIVKLQKLAVGKSSEKIDLALKYLLVTVAEDDDGHIDEG